MIAPQPRMCLLANFDGLYKQIFYRHVKKFLLFITMRCEYRCSLVVFVIRGFAEMPLHGGIKNAAVPAVA